MPRNVTFIVILSALSAFLAAGILLGKKTGSRLGIEFTSACSRIMEAVIRGGQGDVYDFEGIEEYVEPDAYNLALYSVEGDEIENPVYEPVPAEWRDEQQDAALQREAWHIFAALIPPDDRAMVAQFNVFTDGYSNTLAGVSQSALDVSRWTLEVDVADLDDRHALLFTLVHEFAHLLTLNTAQALPDADLLRDPYNPALQTEKAALCPGYFTGYGCSYEDSYMYLFHRRFWADVDDEWRDVDALQYQSDDQLPYYNALYAFYKSHRDRFVDDYAVTHPTEDIAESFAYFVFSPKPPGDSIRDQKVRFFYAYPELVRLRSHILEAACGR